MSNRANKPHLVLVHGWGLGSYVWSSLAKELNGHFTLTLIDLPGYGANASHPCNYHIDVLGKWLATQLPETCILLGWSMGGQIALKASHIARHKIQRLILVASNPKFLQTAEWPGVPSKTWQGFVNSAMQLSTRKLLERFLAIQALGGENAKQHAQDMQNMMQQHPLPNSQALEYGLALLARLDQRELLTNTNIPCDLISGDNDSLTPLKALQQVAAINRNIHLHVIPNAAHAPFISHPHQFIETLLASAQG